LWRDVRCGVHVGGDGNSGINPGTSKRAAFVAETGHMQRWMAMSGHATVAAAGGDDDREEAAGFSPSLEATAVAVVWMTESSS
jgi:hypothetical protein